MARGTASWVRSTAGHLELHWKVKVPTYSQEAKAQSARAERISEEARQGDPDKDVAAGMHARARDEHLDAHDKHVAASEKAAAKGDKKAERFHDAAIEHHYANAMAHDKAAKGGAFEQPRDERGRFVSK